MLAADRKPTRSSTTTICCRRPIGSRSSTSCAHCKKVCRATMRISLYLGIAACLAGMGVVLHGAILSSRDAGFVRSNPEAVSITDGGFGSDYFNLSYRLPEGWAQGLPGPPASQCADLVLVP